MRTLACTFFVNGYNRKVALRKVAKERKFQVVIKGDVMEYTFSDNDTLEQVNGPALTEEALLPHIEWMIRHYFAVKK